MSVVQTITREDWERGGRFAQLEPYVTGVIITDGPVDEELPYAVEDWDMMLGPPPALWYEYWKMRDIHEGGGWELHQTGDDHRDEDNVRLWHHYVGRTILDAWGDDIGEIKIVWAGPQVVDALKVLQLWPGPSYINEEWYLPLLNVRLSRFSSALSQIGFTHIGGWYGRRSMFVYGEPTPEQRARATVETQIAEAIGPYHVAPGMVEGWLAMWDEPGAVRCTLRLFEPLLDVGERVTTYLGKRGYTRVEPWMDGSGVFILTSSLRITGKEPPDGMAQT